MIKAVKIDPGFAKAHAGLADAYIILGFYNFLPAKEVMPKAKQAADAALQLDSSLCEPYCSLGMYYESFEWNLQEAMYNFLESLELNPRYTKVISGLVIITSCGLRENLKKEKSTSTWPSNWSHLSAIGYSTNMLSRLHQVNLKKHFSLPERELKWIRIL